MQKKRSAMPTETYFLLKFSRNKKNLIFKKNKCLDFLPFSTLFKTVHSIFSKKKKT